MSTVIVKDINEMYRVRATRGIIKGYAGSILEISNMSLKIIF